MMLAIMINRPDHSDHSDHSDASKEMLSTSADELLRFGPLLKRTVVGFINNVALPIRLAGFDNGPSKSDVQSDDSGD